VYFIAQLNQIEILCADKSCAVVIEGKLQPCSKVEEKTPKCSLECESSYTVSYRQDKHYGEESRSLHSVSAIMEEISTNGPIEGTMEVYEDFLAYKSGR